MPDIGFVVGNGPSLRGFNLHSLEPNQTLGMNAAYRYWDEIDWYPSFYCCLDDQLIETHHAEINALYEAGHLHHLFLHGRFFELHPDKIGNPSFLSFDQVSPHWYKQRGAKLGLAFVDHPAFHTSDTSKVTTGAYAVRYMAYNGFRTLALMGIDLRYVEVLPEAVPTEGVGLVMTQTPTANPNYFFDGYQREGDRFNIPNPSVHEGNLHLRSFELVGEDFKAKHLEVEVFNTNPESLLQDHRVFPLAEIQPLLNAVERDKPPALGAVIVPCNSGEIEQVVANLHLWSQPAYAPFVSPPAVKPVLAMVFNNRTAEAQSQQIADAFESLPVKDSFSRLEIHFLDLEGERDAYIRRYDVAVDEHGNKAGPNNQFFGAMRLARDLGRYSFLMEADCIPIRAGWLAHLQGIAAAPDTFWVSGSAYRGKNNLAPILARHINGNAIYACGDREFQRFLDQSWEPKLRDIVKRVDRRAAYDYVMEFVQDGRHGEAGDPGWDFWRSHAHLFRYTDFIQNASGVADLENPDPGMVAKALQSPTSYVLHATPLALAVREAFEAGVAFPSPRKLVPVAVRRKVDVEVVSNTLGFSHYVEMGTVARVGSADVFRISGAADANNLKCVIAGSIKPGNHIASEISLLLRRPAMLWAGLARHDPVSRYESSSFQTFELSAGQHSIALEHTFKYQHLGVRIQLASATGEPIEFEVLHVRATRGDAAPEQGQPPEPAQAATSSARAPTPLPAADAVSSATVPHRHGILKSVFFAMPAPVQRVVRKMLRP